MILTIIIAIVSIIALVVIHEFGHFIVAKKCGVDVEEFGVGYPPRLVGKKIGNTLYSLNLIPFGAFVRLRGESGGIEDYQSFVGKPIWQRVLIVLGGVVAFWIVAAIILGIIAGIGGLPMAVGDEENSNLVNPKVQIIAVVDGSPAQKGGLKAGDIILDIQSKGQTLINATKIKQVQKFTKEHLGQEIILTIKRGRETSEVPIVPRVSSPEGEGAMGIGLARVGLKFYPWYQAPGQGIKFTGILTANIVNGWVMGLKSALGIEKLPPGVKMELMGPLGIFSILTQYFERGINYFLYLVALISIALALANILPIPALDGGKLVFLVIEAVRKKPISRKIEQNVTAFFFILLIVLMIYITVRFDIPRVF